jgi:hypothetical protein
MSAVRETVAGIAAERDDQARRYAPRTDAKPTSKQTWLVAHLFAEIAGVDWPETRAAASELITTLQAQRDAVRAAAGNDGMPF